MKKCKLLPVFLTISIIFTLFQSCTQSDKPDKMPYISYENIDNIEVTENTENIEDIQRSTGTASKSSDGTQIYNLPLTINPTDYISQTNLNVQHKKAYTVMVYMNGSDLESDYMAATTDLNEMINSRFDNRHINLIIFTGGAKKWHTAGIPNKDNAVFRMINGKLEKLVQYGRDPMGYPETLCGFINFAYNYFPAEQYALIFWNHGGGAITGYGSDERYKNPDKAMMQLSEIDCVLENNDLYRNGEKFEFIGFDTCLMATLEMACIAADYANYLIASEELEPDGGWDYTFLRNITPGISGGETGKLITDYYRDFYINSDLYDILTISVTDLSKIDEVTYYFEELASAGKDYIKNGNYRYISKVRSSHRSFGSRGEFADETDMIDVKNLAESLSGMFPDEANNLIDALNNAVIYKYEENIEELGGLSVYFPFANKSDLNYYMWVYSTVNRLPEYFQFLDSFCVILDSPPRVSYRGTANSSLNKENIIDLNNINENYIINLSSEQIEYLAEIYQTTWKKSAEYNKYIQIAETKKVKVNDDGTVETNFSGDCITLNNNLICLYENTPTTDGVRYSVPIKLNDKDADLIVIYCEKYPDGKIIGAIPAGDDIYDILDKKIINLKKGDKIQILYYSESFGISGETTETMSDGKNEQWQKGNIITVETDGGVDLVLRREKLEEGEYIYGLNFVDLQCNKYYSNFLSVVVE